MSNNELRNRSSRSSNEQVTDNELVNEQNPTNRLNFDDEDFVYLLNLSNFNWRIMLAPLLNLFNHNTTTNETRTAIQTNSDNEQSATNDSPIINTNQNSTNSQQLNAEQTTTNAQQSFNDGLLTETLNIHLNIDQNTIFISRSQLIRVIFFKITTFYVIFFPSYIRKAIEYGLLLSAVLSFLTLIYLHSLFIRSPINCLQNVQWNGDGILRVEILDEQEKLINLNLEKNSSTTDLDKNLKEFEIFSKQIRPSNFYVVEYSLEHGFLRLSQDARSKLNISIMTITLDPNKDQCFGDQLSKFILKYFLGYNDILLNSLKGLAENQSSRGFIKNLVTGMKN